MTVINKTLYITKHDVEKVIEKEFKNDYDENGRRKLVKFLMDTISNPLRDLAIKVSATTKVNAATFRRHSRFEFSYDKPVTVNGYPANEAISELMKYLSKTRLRTRIAVIRHNIPKEVRLRTAEAVMCYIIAQVTNNKIMETDNVNA